MKFPHVNDDSAIYHVYVYTIVYTNVYTILSWQWYLPSQLGTWWSLLSASSNLSGAAGPLVLTLAAHHLGWRSVMTLTGKRYLLHLKKNFILGFFIFEFLIRGFVFVHSVREGVSVSLILVSQQRG